MLSRVIEFQTKIINHALECKTKLKSYVPKVRIIHTHKFNHSYSCQLCMLYKNNV